MVKRRINTLPGETPSKLPKITILSNQPGPELVKPGAQIAAGGEPPKGKKPGNKRRKNEAPSFLTVEEMDRLFHAISSPRDRAIFRVGYHAGLRASEIGLLEMRDYDQRAKRLMLTRLKGSHSGEHYVTSRTARALVAWIKIRGDHPGPIFTSNRKRPIGRRMLDVLMKQYGLAASIPASLCHFHVLKHSCATHLLSMGYNVEQVQVWLGHANIQSTLEYARVTDPRREQMGKELRDRW